MERNDPERERKDPERADPITRLIASRVREIRDQQRLSGAALGAAVRDLGLTGWVDSTVGKLETRRRESVTVRELLALSVALGVPPVWLLADPKAGTPVPIAEGVEVDPWSALLWLIGRQPLAEPTGAAWNDAAAQLESFERLAGGLQSYDQQRNFWTKYDDAVGPPQDEIDRLGLRAISDRLGIFEHYGWPVPPLPAHVRKRAAELGVELPGQDVTP